MKSMMIYFIAVLMLSAIINSNEIETEKTKIKSNNEFENRGN
jgi:hypothetical protein